MLMLLQGCPLSTWNFEQGCGSRAVSSRAGPAHSERWVLTSWTAHREPLPAREPLAHREPCQLVSLWLTVSLYQLVSLWLTVSLYQLVSLWLTVSLCQLTASQTSSLRAIHQRLTVSSLFQQCGSEIAHFSLLFGVLPAIMHRLLKRKHNNKELI